MPGLGIAVITFRRLKALQRTLRRLADCTRSPYELVIAEDGGRDGTVAWCRKHGYRVISGANRGVSWNKNRGLFALASQGCDPIILLEDDCFPVEIGWEADWIRATQLWDHVSYAPKKIFKGVIGGQGTPDDPFVSLRASAQCSTISRRALEAVGYFDTRFTGFGIEHKEWTNRLKALGYGTRVVAVPSDVRIKNEDISARRNVSGSLHMVGGLKAPNTRSSHRNPTSVARNRITSRALKRAPLFRRPWQDEAEKEAFLRELDAAEIVDQELVAALEAAAAVHPGSDKASADSPTNELHSA